ncbi:zinc-ribbon domain-containing protein [Anoxybacillus sp.]|uniref:zinc-ribbon domain-containing protein n=1 Tax=Anoxybacillus sp. TaxID=1872573 RepID=UPI00261B058E|nr:zinc-ribbon domain-containing protein [uncultured Anoxybacillus sp.]
MKSIKPGRGPSMQGFVGSLFSIIFGIFWTFMTFSITKDSPFPGTQIFPLFGLIFVGLGIFQAVYHYKNATGKERMSIVDIVDEHEEKDPLNERFGRSEGKKYCSSCGTNIQADFRFCPSCGKEL